MISFERPLFVILLKAVLLPKKRAIDEVGGY
jgi:hypothetical protein